MEDIRTVTFNTNTLRVSIELGNNSEKRIEELHFKSDFGLFYGFCLLASIITFVADIIMHCWLAYIFHLKKELLFFILTVTFIIVPSIISTGFSMRWYILDEDDETSPSKPSCSKWSIRICTLLFQITQIHRYFDVLCYGLRSIFAKYRKDQLSEDYFYRKMLDEDCDAALLRLFYCILNSAPQAVLQLSIVLFHELERRHTDYQEYQLSSIIVSSFSVAWSLVVFNRTSRYIREDHERLSWKGILLHFLSYLMWTVSRILALSMITVFYPKCLLLGCFAHSFIMTIWLLFHHDSNHNCCDECVLSYMLGIAYIFIFISSRSGPQRYSYTMYYFICLVENIGCLAVWHQNTRDDSVLDISLRYGAIAAQLGLFFLSVLCMVTYYKYFHPSRKMYKVVKKCYNKENQTDLLPEKPLMHNYT